MLRERERERERERRGEERRITIVIKKLLNEVNMSHKHSPAAVTDQPQSIKCISTYHIIKH